MRLKYNTLIVISSPLPTRLSSVAKANWRSGPGAGSSFPHPHHGALSATKSQ
jgi:hypothetical protein